MEEELPITEVAEKKRRLSEDKPEEKKKKKLPGALFIPKVK